VYVPEMIAMLTFTRGTEVEVLSKRVVEEGAWVSAEVLKTTAYTCTVKYGGGDEIVEETVPRMAVRPLPPPLEEGAAKLTAGDLVECYHNFCWKTARILNSVTDNIFLVLLLGDSDVGFTVHKSFLRVRQRWTGGGWRVLEKNSPAGYMEKRMNACAKRKPCGDYSPIKDDTRKNLTDVYMEKIRKCKCSKRKPCEDYSPIKKDIAGRLDEDSVGSCSSTGNVGDFSETCRPEGNESDAESVCTERRITSVDLNITLLSDDEES
jgi:hypothetical protein